MYTRSRLVGPGSGTSSISRNQAGDGQRSDLGLKQHRRQSLEVAAPKDSTMERQGHAEQSSAGAYTVITPNESRRQKFLRVAEQELADLKRWKEQNRAKLVHLVPQRLGGSQSESEVRQKQQLQQMRSKYQQKLKREESIRIRKEAEEAELQKMKAIQREKSNKLEEKKQLQENIRRDTFREHHQSKTAEFLSRLDTERNRSACQIRPHAAQSSTWASSQAHRNSLRKEDNQKLQKMKHGQHQKNKLLETKGQHQEEERAQIHQAEHRRVNNAFLDRLQGKSQPGGLEQSGGCWTMNSTNSWGI
ncbi:epithelial-stromal interaction protein 1 isoform X2 [Meriones unguiculatus]|uniref:epithelial-stromal interaction protein 1 isoform X2 n=1 Tax=Meriones unguiculatus TaxID=10047 RepID=UPI000B4EF87C|nr:epithelial-stromal interaction protein 1 isoform X2 [Meriones unguiculatus]XP_021511376.1 epithelial-stromal interaction protein 1-like isoform X2 [Meriones unguiculatus]